MLPHHPINQATLSVCCLRAVTALLCSALGCLDECEHEGGADVGTRGRAGSTQGGRHVCGEGWETSGHVSPTRVGSQRARASHPTAGCPARSPTRGWESAPSSSCLEAGLHRQEEKCVCVGGGGGGGGGEGGQRVVRPLQPATVQPQTAPAAVPTRHSGAGQRTNHAACCLPELGIRPRPGHGHGHAGGKGALLPRRLLQHGRREGSPLGHKHLKQAAAAQLALQQACIIAGGVGGGQVSVVCPCEGVRGRRCLPVPLPHSTSLPCQPSSNPGLASPPTRQRGRRLVAPQDGPAAARGVAEQHRLAQHGGRPLQRRRVGGGGAAALLPLQLFHLHSHRSTIQSRRKAYPTTGEGACMPGLECRSCLLLASCVCAAPGVPGSGEMSPEGAGLAMCAMWQQAGGTGQRRDA